LNFKLSQKTPRISSREIRPNMRQ